MGEEGRKKETDRNRGVREGGKGEMEIEIERKREKGRQREKKRKRVREREYLPRFSLSM